MKINKKQKNNKTAIKMANQGGFTIIEAMIAILILAFAIISLLSLTASSISSAKYSNNEITANYLLQEAIDSVRNSRDTIAFQRRDTGGGWNSFLNKYNNCLVTTNVNGCYLKMESFDPTNTSGLDVASCGSATPAWGSVICPVLNYNSSLSSSATFYTTSGGTASNFKRQIKMESINGGDGVKVTVIMEWKNGTAVKSKSLEVSLLNWQK